ncbi:phage tail tube protein [Pontibacter sp. JAM-7]|uniref:phage tail tube protein n=1 Tax=Pontibacter sp. JAM-7 TaxID=3366581 RepID=UPI003AF68779
MAVLDAQGATVTFNDGTTAQTVGGCVSFSFGDGQAADIDITTLASTAMEYRQGLQDFGDCTIELKRDPNDVGQAAMETAKAAQATREVVITLPSDDVATFNAYVKSISSSGGVNDVLNGTATLKVTGSVVWSTVV